MSLVDTRRFKEDPSKSARGRQYGSDPGNSFNLSIETISDESVDCAGSDTKTLNIINEFKKLYEDKMKIIDADGDGDCNIQAKISLQQDWIRDLTEQNEMLVRAVEALEQEATERVLCLEEKLKQTSKCACEVMNGYKNISINLEETFQNVDRLESDIQNLLELIRRIRDEGSWSVEGLEFYNVNKSVLIERKSKSTISTSDKTSKKLKEKEQRIKELELALKDMKKDDFLILKDPSYAALKQSMLDMRDALTAEVADKHDMILALRRDVQLLEDQCRKADQQTHFKDDIIKELRKEIKQLKQDTNYSVTLDNVRKSYSNCGVQTSPLEFTQTIHNLGKLQDLFSNYMYSSTKRFNKMGTARFTTNRRKIVCDNTLLKTKKQSWSIKHRLGSPILSSKVKYSKVKCSKRKSLISYKKPNYKRLRKHLSLPNLKVLIFDKIDKSGSAKCKLFRNTFVNENLLSFHNSCIPNKMIVMPVYINDRCVPMSNSQNTSIIVEPESEEFSVEDNSENYDEYIMSENLNENHNYTNTATAYNCSCESKTYGSIHEIIERTVNEVLVLRMQEQIEHLIKKSYDDDRQIVELYDLVSMAVRQLIMVFNSLDILEDKAKMIKEDYENNLKYLKMESDNVYLIGENKELQETVKEVKLALRCLECRTEQCLREKEDLEAKTTESLYLIKCLEAEKLKFQHEVEILNHKCQDTEKRLKLQQEVAVLNRKTENRQNHVERTCTTQVTFLEDFEEESPKCTSKSTPKCTNKKEYLEADHGKKCQVRTIGVQPIKTQTESKYVNTSPTALRTKRRKCQQKDVTTIETDSDFSDSQDDVRVLKSAISNNSQSRSSSPDRTKKSKCVVINETVTLEDAGSGIKESVSQLIVNEAISNKSRSRSISPDNIKKSKHVVINETVMLEDAVSGIKESVSRLIVNEGKNKEAKKRIAELEQELEKINKKDEIIDIQNDTLNIVENELQAWRTKDSEVEAARSCREREICNLKEVIESLVKKLDYEKQRSGNLQNAVDLYLNSISVLQESEEQFKKEISEQKVTISNLQDVLVATKHTLEESQQKANTDYNQYLKLVDKLRDENLLLEVDLFYTSQDIQIYESRVLKYQHICRDLESQCVVFNEEMKILEQQENQHFYFMNELSQQLAECQDKLKELYQQLSDEQWMMNNESKGLRNHMLALQVEHGETSQKLCEALENLECERQNSYCLKEEISMKDYQLCCLKKELHIIAEKLKSATCELIAHKEKINALQNRQLGYEQSILMLEHDSAECQKSVLFCFENLRETQDQLAQRTNDYDKLQMEHQNCNQYYKEEIARYQQNLVNLEDQLQEKDVIFNNEVANYMATIKEFEDKNSSDDCNCDQTEAKIQQEYSQKEHMYKQQINSFKNEQERLIAVVTKLEDRLAMLDCELLQKDKMLDTIKKSMLSLQNSNIQQVQIHQVEVCSLKNEINNLIQQQSFVKSENEQLQAQLSKFHNIVSKNDDKNKLMIQELQQCLNELHVIQGDKAFLIEKNEQLVHEIQNLQDTCQMKTESVVTLEMELSDTKCLKDSLCNESRNVINNVKAWLQEQRTINVELSNKLKKKNSLINKLTEENKQLKRKESSSPTVHYSNHGSFLTCTSSPIPFNCRNERSREGLWSLGSVESPGFSSDSEWETNDNQTEESPEVFIHRVESLTQELHKTNRYWKNKMNEHDYIVSKDK